nr:MAG TPA: hypothetical protein [Caudoviricetes sp.]
MINEQTGPAAMRQGLFLSNSQSLCCNDEGLI